MSLRFGFCGWLVVFLVQFSQAYGLSQITEQVATPNKIQLHWDGFLDVQVTHDLNKPRLRYRPHSSQMPAVGEFNVNLAYLAASFEQQDVRGRLALQSGASVDWTYQQEVDQLRGLLQEARLGRRLGPQTWIDAGVFFSHLGAESWVSKDNLTLSRSLVADASPYYLSGLKIEHQFAQQFKAKVLIVNGWQNINENNYSKSIGTSLEYATDAWSFAHNGLYGKEGLLEQDRLFNNFIVKLNSIQNWSLVAQIDVGSQAASKWFGYTVFGRYRLRPQRWLVLRIEHLKDAEQIVLNGPSRGPVDLSGASLGFDAELSQQMLWRLEARYLKGNDTVFPKEATSYAFDSLVLATSLAMSF